MAGRRRQADRRGQLCQQLPVLLSVALAGAELERQAGSLPHLQNVAQYADLRTMSVMEAFDHPTVQAARKLFKRKRTTDPAPDPCKGCAYFERHHGAPPKGREEPVQTLLAPAPAVALAAE